PGTEPFLLLEFVWAKARKAASALLFRQAISAPLQGFQGITTAKGVPNVRFGQRHLFLSGIFLGAAPVVSGTIGSNPSYAMQPSRHALVAGAEQESQSHRHTAIRTLTSDSLVNAHQRQQANDDEQQGCTTGQLLFPATDIRLFFSFLFLGLTAALFIADRERRQRVFLLPGHVVRAVRGPEGC
ncbi:MAG: hypothetical protein QGI09_08865, partial [Dehalococcoidia bacterium]|nr:hypothetical protein [Dehalococcoidia bacterium]